MGQYHRAINVTKEEIIDPYKIGFGAKQWEQIANEDIPVALFMLLCVSNKRGGGDLQVDEYDPETKKGILGRWAGDDIRIVGDYGEEDDLPEGKDYVSYEETTGWADISEMLVEAFNSGMLP